MNIFKKCYCRIYQFGFKMALPFLPYREPELVNGFNEVPDILKRNRISDVLIVTDQGVYKLGLTKDLEDALERNGIKYTVYKDTVPNPTTENVETAKDLYIENNCEALIAVGGGSSMDCAKGVGIRIARPDKPLKHFAGVLKVHKKLPLFIATPTTAGTGSETTLAAVITDAETHHKYPINDFPLIPMYAVMHPEITYGLPPFLTATTGMDAMTHAVEAFIGNTTTKGTREASIKAVKLISDNIVTAYNEPTNFDARNNMLHAAYLAGTAFTKSYVGYVHAVAHSLGGKYGIAHGLANSVLLPIVLKEYGHHAWKKLAKLARATGISDDPSNEKAANAFIAHIEDLNKALSIPDKLEGIKEEDIPELAKTADKEGNPLYPVPVLWDAAQLEKIYRLVMK